LVVTNHRKPVLRIEPIRSRGTLGEVFKGVSTGLSVSREELLAPETEGWEVLR
jgi:antitoxin (DNA-binding transcriptional repressor) of toxin-antitoxin stability system